MIVKGAGVLERLGATSTVLLDKTGMVTSGDPEIEAIVELGALPAEETLRLAASLDQLSAHVLAESLVRGTEDRGIRLATPVGVSEEPGRGIAGVVDGRRVTVGSSGWLETHGYAAVGDHARALDDRHGAGGRRSSSGSTGCSRASS